MGSRRRMRMSATAVMRSTSTSADPPKLSRPTGVCKNASKNCGDVGNERLFEDAGVSTRNRFNMKLPADDCVPPERAT